MSFYIGGYIAARLKPRASVSEHETDVRDGLHGLVVWGVGVIAAGVIALAGIGGVGAVAHAPENQTIASTVQAASQEVDQSVDQAASEEPSANPQARDESAVERRANIARKVSVIAAFITAASLLAGAVAAFFGAHAGGQHRDRNVMWAFFTSQSRLGR
jgi:cytoskeletal protein RodZ